MRKRWAGGILLVLLVAGCACLGGCSRSTTSTATQRTPAATAVWPVIVPGSETSPYLTFTPIITATQRDLYSDALVTDSGEVLHVTLSEAGAIDWFQPGDRWILTRDDGNVLMSGTVAGEATMYEGLFGFVRLDDGRLVAYSVGNNLGWTLHPADQICHALEAELKIPAAYIQNGVVQEEPLLAATCDTAENPSGSPCRDSMTGTVRGIAICVQDLGIDQYLTILP